MGCDIHFFLEKKVDGQWKSMDKWTIDDEEDESYKYVKYDDSFYGGRNYNLFSILADVRNGYGFAGCDTGDGFTPISYPKGLPKDVTSEVKSYSDGYGIDGHSHSWYTLKELEDYDWTTKKTKQRMLIPSENYEKWKNGDHSTMGWGGGGPPRISIEDLEKLPEDKRSGYSVQVEWEETYKDAVDTYFHNTTIPKMQELAKDVGPENVRCVFFFDN